MPVSPVHHSNTTLPVQPAALVAPVKPKDPGGEGPPKVKAATPPHVGKNIDVHA